MQTLSLTKFFYIVVNAKYCKPYLYCSQAFWFVIIYRLVNVTGIEDLFHQVSFCCSLRMREVMDESKDDELLHIKSLLSNATRSLSKMSMTLAEHQLTIPNIFDVCFVSVLL